MTINLPVSIGDHVYFIRDHENQKRIAFGTIKEIFFSQDMRLMIRVKGYRAAEWGVKAFRTRKEAETAIGNTVRKHRVGKRKRRAEKRDSGV